MVEKWVAFLPWDLHLYVSCSITVHWLLPHNSSCISTGYLRFPTNCWLNSTCQHPPRLPTLCFMQKKKKKSRFRHLFSMQKCYWFSFSPRSTIEWVSKRKKRQKYTDKALCGNSSREGSDHYGPGAWYNSQIISLAKRTNLLHSSIRLFFLTWFWPILHGFYTLQFIYMRSNWQNTSLSQKGSILWFLTLTLTSYLLTFNIK